MAGLPRRSDKIEVPSPWPSQKEEGAEEVAKFSFSYSISADLALLFERRAGMADEAEFEEIGAVRALAGRRRTC